MIDLAQTAVIGAWVAMTIFLLRRVKRSETWLSSLSDRVAVRETEDPQPICGCEHHQCFHDESGCGHEKNAYDAASGGWGILTCGCKGYIGPEQLPSVIP